jgi:RNA polymerase sigma-70 factor (ECF subfamily)
MHDVQGMPHADIARITRCSEGTVRSRLFYARKQLQMELAEFMK